MQTTLIVFAMVLLVGLFLWLVDIVLTWAVHTLTSMGV